VGIAATGFCYLGGILQVFHRQDQQILRLPTAAGNQIASNQGKIPSGGHHTSLDDHIQLWRVHHIWPFRRIRSKQGKKRKKEDELRSDRGRIRLAHAAKQFRGSSEKKHQETRQDPVKQCMAEV
jgi:hypothetical protein